MRWLPALPLAALGLACSEPPAEVALDGGVPRVDAAPTVDAAAPDAAPAIPNLVLLPERILPTIRTDVIEFGPSSCSVAEGCASYGKRWMLRFDTVTLNDGTADMFLGAPPPDGQDADPFEWSQCHGHHHFKGYALYELVDQQGQVVLSQDGPALGRKQAFCLENTDRIDPDAPTQLNARYCDDGDGPDSNCMYHCDYQGISKGWADTYKATLPCQWIDICHVAPGAYFLRITVNPEQLLPESRYDDNVLSAPVSIPVAPGDSGLCL